ncbi:unnamed protein product [Tilletia laevis]|uniref:Uncharacterized protein n=2 Tax=Tilletia TaxID=13289 RepID=A0A8T8TG46_9BASI|nr:hypothetical protein CF335_g3585 [Tilletia laevis]KAE8260594.1 hypothetical protein A4X03_0g3765 [Tilletia caries]CAD6887252.1 unnamed protein product [Tilletia caries]CAD6918888.1 unnamed protein product [Tilletia laevis]CAD6947499.1 unnamed protein product [Tilletia caries]
MDHSAPQPPAASSSLELSTAPRQPQTTTAPQLQDGGVEAEAEAEAEPVIGPDAAQLNDALSQLHAHGEGTSAPELPTHYQIPSELTSAAAPARIIPYATPPTQSNLIALPDLLPGGHGKRLKKSRNAAKPAAPRKSVSKAQPAAESSSAAAARRVMPARLKRVGNLLEGSALGTELAGLISDETFEVTGEHSISLPPNTRIFCTTEHDEYLAKAWEDTEAASSYKSYFDNEEVQQACRERAKIETPEFEVWDEVTFQGRKRFFEPTTDLSIGAYRALQRTAILREKRQRKLERDKVIKDRNKVEERIEMLRTCESKQFFPIVRARQAVRATAAVPSTSTVPMTVAAEALLEPANHVESPGQGRTDQIPVLATVNHASAGPSSVTEPTLPRQQDPIARETHSVPVANPDQTDLQGSGALNALPALPVAETSSASLSATEPPQPESVSTSNGAHRLEQDTDLSGLRSGMESILALPSIAIAPESAISLTALGTPVAGTTPTVVPTIATTRGKRKAKEIDESISSGPPGAHRQLAQQNPALIAASLSAAAAGTRLSATMSDEAQLMHVAAEELRKELIEEATKTLQKYNVAIEQAAIGLEAILGENDEGPAAASGSGAKSGFQGAKAAGAKLLAGRSSRLSMDGAPSQHSATGQRRPRYAESSTENSDDESTYVVRSRAATPVSKKPRRSESGMTRANATVARRNVSYGGKMDHSIDSDATVDSVQKEASARAFSRPRRSRNITNFSEDDSQCSEPAALVKPRVTVSASARRAGIRHARNLLVRPLNIPFRTFDDILADPEPETEESLEPELEPERETEEEPQVQLPQPQVPSSAFSPTRTRFLAEVPSGQPVIGPPPSLEGRPNLPLAAGGVSLETDAPMRVPDGINIPAPALVSMSTPLDRSVDEERSVAPMALDTLTSVPEVASSIVTPSSEPLPSTAIDVESEADPPVIPVQRPKYRPGSLICVDVPPRPSFHTLLLWGCWPFTSPSLGPDATEEEVRRNRGQWSQEEWDRREFGDQEADERSPNEIRNMLLYGWTTSDRSRPKLSGVDAGAAGPSGSLPNNVQVPGPLSASESTRPAEAAVTLPQNVLPVAGPLAEGSKREVQVKPLVHPPPKYETVEETHLHKVSASLLELSETHVAHSKLMAEWDEHVRSLPDGVPLPPKPEWEDVLRDVCGRLKVSKSSKGKGKEKAEPVDATPLTAAELAQERLKDLTEEWQTLVDALGPDSQHPPKPDEWDVIRVFGAVLTKPRPKSAAKGSAGKSKVESAPKPAAPPKPKRVTAVAPKRKTSSSSVASSRPTRSMRSSTSSVASPAAPPLAPSAALPMDAPAALSLASPAAPLATSSMAPPASPAAPPLAPSAAVPMDAPAALSLAPPAASLATSSTAPPVAPPIAPQPASPVKSASLAAGPSVAKLSSPTKRKTPLQLALGTRSSSARIRTVSAFGEKLPLDQLQKDRPFDHLAEYKFRKWGYLTTVDAGDPSVSATSARGQYVGGTEAGSDSGSGRWRALMEMARERHRTWVESCRAYDAKKRPTNQQAQMQAQTQDMASTSNATSSSDPPAQTQTRTETQDTASTSNAASSSDPPAATTEETVGSTSTGAATTVDAARDPAAPVTSSEMSLDTGR